MTTRSPKINTKTPEMVEKRHFPIKTYETNEKVKHLERFAVESVRPGLVDCD